MVDFNLVLKIGRWLKQVNADGLKRNMPAKDKDDRLGRLGIIQENSAPFHMMDGKVENINTEDLKWPDEAEIYKLVMREAAAMEEGFWYTYPNPKLYGISPLIKLINGGEHPTGT